MKGTGSLKSYLYLHVITGFILTGHILIKVGVIWSTSLFNFSSHLNIYLVKNTIYDIKFSITTWSIVVHLCQKKFDIKATNVLF